MTDQRSIILANHVKELEARCAVMADQITRLNQAQEAALKESIPNGLDAAALKPIEERLDQQAKQLKATEQSLEKVRTAQAAIVSASSKKSQRPSPKLNRWLKPKQNPRLSQNRVLEKSRWPTTQTRHSRKTGPSRAGR